MTEFLAGQFDIAVIGAGHAGIEAALAAARLGMETIVFTINLDAVGNMPCNPAIGGTGKGHLVRELDALGGEMAKAADACCIQYRLLNKGKGPAVWSLRAQADRRRYQEYMKHTLEQQDHLTVRQGEVVEVRTENGAVSAVVLATGAVFSVKAVILATGTYLAGRTIVGECVEESGPDGMHAAGRLTDSLLKLGLPLRRFKTGTPPRVNARSVDFDEMELQPGDALPVPFSYGTQSPPENRAVCCSPGPRRRRSGSSGRIWTGRPCTPASSRGWAPATAPPLRPRWSGSRTSSATSCLWSPWASTLKNCTSRASPPPCRRRCRSGCSAACRACAMP